ncbi:hypothetical protein [Nonomuraea sp. NPDC049607]|uniref:hypothetical protein n=1 Tax=Nonomuraea sp. NPDC049607 TaxID=3154732 RepID=UPI003413DAFC
MPSPPCKPPHHRREFVGPRLKLLTPSARARSEDLARRLCEVSTQLTGVRFEELTHR